MNQPTNLCKSNPDFTKFSLEFLKFSIEFDSRPNSALNLPKSDLDFAKIQPCPCQNHTLTLLKFSLEFLQFSLEFTNIRPWLCPKSNPTLPKWGDLEFTKNKIRHQLYQNRTLSFEQYEFFCSLDLSVGDSLGTLLFVAMHQRHQVRVKPWMALVAGFSLMKLMGAFVPPLQVGDGNAFSRHGCVCYADRKVKVFLDVL